MKRMLLSNSCIAFPGRDAIFKGMDKSFYSKCKEVRDTFLEANNYLNVDIKKICFGNYIEQQWQTVCLVTYCYGIYKTIVKNYGIPNVLIGYSQGEFTACTASGVLKFPEVLGLIYQLDKILTLNKNDDECMYRIIDLDVNVLITCCNQIDATASKVCISSFISKDQNIISGKKIYVSKVIELAKLNKARWSIDLKSDKAYHSKLCNEVAISAKPFFQNVKVGKANIPVYSCYDGEKSSDGLDIRDKLSKQIDHPIQWNKIINNLVDEDITESIEIGPGCTVSANSRIANERINCRWIGSIEDLW